MSFVLAHPRTRARPRGTPRAGSSSRTNRRTRRRGIDRRAWRTHPLLAPYSIVPHRLAMLREPASSLGLSQLWKSAPLRSLPRTAPSGPALAHVPGASPRRTPRALRRRHRRSRPLAPSPRRPARLADRPARISMAGRATVRSDNPVPRLIDQDEAGEAGQPCPGRRIRGPSRSPRGFDRSTRTRR